MRIPSPSWRAWGTSTSRWATPTSPAPHNCPSRVPDVHQVVCAARTGQGNRSRGPALRGGGRPAGGMGPERVTFGLLRDVCYRLYPQNLTHCLYLSLSRHRIFASHVLLSLSAFYFAPLPSSIFDMGLKGCCFQLGWWDLAKRKGLMERYLLIIGRSLGDFSLCWASC